MTKTEIKLFLDQKAALYNHTGFIKNDPISIPHLFTRRQDIEIAGLFAAVLAWGQRVTIINKCNELMKRMDHAPYEFILHHKERDLKALQGFKHRTFNDTDLLYFVSFLNRYYKKNASLEDAFLADGASVEAGLIRFHELFFSYEDHPSRTRKHISTPERKSTCKRLCMYLRWMVRHDNNGVDFGIWKRIPAAQLICPCDVHVDRVARKLKLIRSRQTNWSTALELTNNLRTFDPADPVKYDFALFGLGVMEGWV
ncbi:MAG TPA: TIGR02757 family protein [Cyclobacteriaceae bacterium]|nr:TIGR02757 family protein [Cyclobacteriaceae bacterium]